jgi:hypothetical protein
LTQFRSALLVIALGILGAGLSVTSLLMSQTDAARNGVGFLIANQLPILIVVSAMGFGAGALVAIAWLVTQRLFGPDVPRA